MSDESDNNSIDSNEEEEEESELEIKIKRFSDKDLIISSTVVEIKSKEDLSTRSLLNRIKKINNNLDQVGSNLSEAIDKYNKNTNSIQNAYINQSSYSKDVGQLNQVNSSIKQKPIPQQFDDFNNPYKKITSYGNSSSKYKNNINELYQQPLANSNNSIFAENKSNQSLSQSNQGPTKIYYRRANNID